MAASNTKWLYVVLGVLVLLVALWGPAWVKWAEVILGAIVAIVALTQK